MSRQPNQTSKCHSITSCARLTSEAARRGGEAEGEKESFPREMGKKFMDSAAEEAGSQTVDYVKDNMQPMLDDAQAQIDDFKDQAQAEIDDAKEQALAQIAAAKAQAQAAKERAQAELDEKKQQAQNELK
ncbi:hypothetical protein B0H17DRAFT_1039381 [Mycena rosella]|uniref:Uncharacterized protein n=1 Tax=Mycena rosella TaxID=1033263 RepID=A0AAD7GSL2_MYCRO|nr:hypothetical protein B0H17DRAFT_1039381 [Mycena rosella]